MKSPSTINISEFIKEIVVYTKDSIPNLQSKNELHLKLKNNEIQLLDGKKISFDEYFQSVNWPTFGRCHTLRIKPNIKSLTVMGLAITTKLSNYIYVHHDGQFLSNSRPPKVQVGIGQKLYVNVNHNMVYAMANPYKKHGMNCSDDNNHGLDHCIIEVSHGDI